MVIKYRIESEEAPMQGTAYDLDERETRLLRQYQIATIGNTQIPEEATNSTIISFPGMEEKMEKVIFLAGLNIKEDLTKKEE